MALMLELAFLSGRLWTPTAADHACTPLHTDTTLRETLLPVPNRALRRSLLYEDMEMFTKKKNMKHALVYDVDHPIPAGSVLHDLDA